MTAWIGQLIHNWFQQMKTTTSRFEQCIWTNWLWTWIVQNSSPKHEFVPKCVESNKQSVEKTHNPAPCPPARLFRGECRAIWFLDMAATSISQNGKKRMRCLPNVLDSCTWKGWRSPVPGLLYILLHDTLQQVTVAVIRHDSVPTAIAEFHHFEADESTLRTNFTEIIEKEVGTMWGRTMETMACMDLACSDPSWSSVEL